MEESIFRLHGLRKLSYAMYGPEDGKPVLYFHGTPSSRKELLLLENYGVNLDYFLHSAGLRLIAVDRPGMGLSTYNPEGTFISFADDVRQLLAHLNISRCPVLCWSGGGPYALAMAWKHSAVIQSVYVLCGFTRRFDQEVLKLMSLNKWYFRAAKHTPLLLRFILKILRYKKIRKSPPQQVTGLPYEDYRFLRDAGDLQAVSDVSMKEACRLGSKGAVSEARRYFNGLGFPLSGIQQPVHFWWGTKDETVIRLHAEEIEKEVPNNIMHYKEQEGHLSIYVNCFPEVLQTISYHYP
jgi:pimeloyl-ACP methyl ester carboxylesterase